jgi:hypothetical protein
MLFIICLPVSHAWLTLEFIGNFYDMRGDAGRKGSADQDALDDPGIKPSTRRLWAKSSCVWSKFSTVPPTALLMPGGIISRHRRDCLPEKIREALTAYERERKVNERKRKAQG